jgi:hypothetical protein
VRPEQVQVNPGDSTDFSVIEETPHKIVYKFWVRKQGEDWQAIGPEETDDERSDHWIFIPPMPSGSEFAYWLGIYGRKNTNWRARLTIAQRAPGALPGDWIIRDTWTEQGELNDAGNGGGVDSTDILRVNLV